MHSVQRLTILFLVVVTPLAVVKAGLVIPDGDPNGMSQTVNLTSQLTHISSLEVTLNISGIAYGGYNGDLYVTLTHGNGYTVLLNRVGVTANNAFGYGDSGVQVTFADNAANGDVHDYRNTLLGGSAVPLAGPLTGIWQPDGRAVDPASVPDTAHRTAMLNSFTGLNPNGKWTLFIADMSNGGTSQLESWSLQVSAVPEPATCLAGLLAIGGVAAYALTGKT